MKHMITVYPTTQNQVVVAIYKVYVISRGLSLSTKPVQEPPYVFVHLIAYNTFFLH